MASKISSDEVGSIQRALNDARFGRATLKQLAHAHDVCETHSASHNLSATIGELREHIRKLTPAPPSNTITSIFKSLLLGTISGIITWTLLGRREDAK